MGATLSGGFRWTVCGLTFVVFVIGISWVLGYRVAVSSLTLFLSFVAVLVELFARLTYRKPVLRIIVVALAVIAIGWLNGGRPYKLGYPGLEHYYATNRLVVFPVLAELPPIDPPTPLKPSTPLAAIYNQIGQVITSEWIGAGGSSFSDRLTIPTVRGKPPRLNYAMPSDWNIPSAY